jgi:O-antigen/teichoic acid export membrane protein
MKSINENLKKLRSIARNELIYVGSDILIKAIAFVSMPFFLNIMTTEDFGAFSLYVTYISIFAIFFGLNISSAIVRYYIDKVNSKKYLATAIWITLVTGAVFSALILSAHYFFGFFRFENKILIIILITTVFSCFTRIGLEIIRSEKNAVLYGFFSVLNSIISTGVGIVLIYTMKNDLAFWRLSSICISAMIVGGILTIRLMYKDGIKGNVETAKYLLSYSIPLIPYAFSTTILAQVNKLFLSQVSLSQVGIYSFASSLAMIIYIIAIALNRSLQPYLFEALRDNKDYENQLKRNIGIFYLFYICFIFGSDVLIWIFGNEAYLGAANIIPILILGYGYFFLYSLYINFMYFYKKNFMISLFSMLSAVIAVIANLILIKPYGYIGAALATLISYFSLFVFGYINVTKRLNIVVLKVKTILILQMMLILPVIIKILVGVL